MGRQVGGQDGAVGQVFQRGLGGAFGQVGHVRDPLEFGGQAEIRQRGEDFRLVGGEGLQQVAEDVFERVVPFGGFVNEGAGFGDGAALRAFAPQLPRDPADEERVALRDLVQVFALFLGGAGEARIFGGEFGDELQGFVAGEAVEAHDARVHVGAAAGGDDGFVSFGQAREELEQARAFFFGQGFQIVEDDQRLLPLPARGAVHWDAHRARVFRVRPRPIPCPVRPAWRGRSGG